MRELSAELRDIFSEAKKVDERLEKKPASREDFDFLVNYKSQCLQQANKLISDEETRIALEQKKVDEIFARLTAKERQLGEEERQSIESRRKKLEEERKQIGEWKGKAKELEEEIARLKTQKEGTVFKKKFTERLGFRVFAAITAIAGGFLFVFIAAYFMQFAGISGIVQYFQQLAAGFGLGSDFSIYFLALIAAALLLPLIIFVFFEKVHKT
jgi:Skp family chaperone for outer membrane proteins